VKKGDHIITGNGRIETGDVGTRWEGGSILGICGGKCCYVGVIEDVGHGDRVGCCSAIVGEGTGGGLYWTAPIQVGIQWLWVGSSVGSEGSFIKFCGGFDSFFCFTGEGFVAVRSGL